METRYDFNKVSYFLVLACLLDEASSFSGRSSVIVL